MTVQQMEEQLNQIPKFGAKASLENLSGYLELLGHPEKKLTVIHVAGTNGKGSTCAFLESAFRKAGYKTGLFTSPHLVDFRERFRIDFEWCEEEALVSAWGQIKMLLDQHEEYGLEPLTYFEIIFVMGVLIFEQEQPDICIMETGLGGRLDATVLCDPILCVITSISYDHTAILGDTIEQIALEKAGIIKEGVPVVALDEKNGAYSVLEKVACEKKSKIFRVLTEDITILKKSKNSIDFSYHSRYYRDSHLHIHSGASYQTANAAVAYTALMTITQLLTPSDFIFSEKAITAGLSGMRWPGRMEEVMPHIYVDGAHNPGAIDQLVSSLKEERGSWRLLFSVCSDKDYSQMVERLCEVPWKKIYITQIPGLRAASIQCVLEEFLKYKTVEIEAYQSIEDAFGEAKKEPFQTEEDNLLCVGSLYLVGELKAIIEKERTDYV